MTIRHFAPRTQQAYIRAIRRFSAFLGASPDQADFEDVRRYQLFLIETGASPPTINHAVTALRFLFQVTLHRPEVMQQIPFVPGHRCINLGSVARDG
jgi:integrase/recombinase XerD